MRIRLVRWCFAAIVLLAHTALHAETVDELLARAERALEQAKQETLDLFSPQHYSKAADALAEAKSLIERKSQEELIRIRLKTVLEEVSSAQHSAETTRVKLSETIAVRTAALTVRADSLSRSLWQKAEDRFNGLVRELESGRSDFKESEPAEVAGQYRAARREALREQILRAALDKTADLDNRKVERVAPEVVLRSHQALSRAEAALAQEDLQAAREHAAAAVKHANHASALMAAADRASKEKFPWEAALLPYDDLLAKAAEHLHGELDLSKGGTAAGQQLFALIVSREESLRAEITHLRETLKSYENSLSEAQTQLSNAQSRLSDLDKRLKTLQSQRTAEKDSAQKASDLSESIARAQAAFTPTEARVFSDSAQRVTIRLTGLKFGAGASTLLRTHQKLVEKAARVIKEFPGARIVVEGHTDNEGGDALNLKLSQTRADAVAKYLAKQLGRAAKEIPAEGYGATHPVADNSTPDGRARNRRIDIVLTLP